MAPLPPIRERPLPFAGETPLGEPLPPQAGRRARGWQRTLFLLMAVLLALGLGAAGTAWYLASNTVKDILVPSPEAAETRKKLAQPLPGEPTNILLMGSDHRVGMDDSDRRSDTMMVVRLDPKRKTISILSFPRDLYVAIPGYGQRKINDAFHFGGTELAVQTVKDLTGLELNFVMTVDFRGFRGVIDTLGGVYVDVDRRYFNDNSGGTNYAVIDIEEGYQRLGGRDALAYARYRHTDSDFHRIARQQYLMTALKKQVGTSEIARNVPGLVKVLDENTDIAAGGSGRINPRTVYDYMRLALALKGRDIYQVELQSEAAMTESGAAIVMASDESIKAAVDALLRPDRDAQEKTADQVAGDSGDSTAEDPLPPPESVRVEVKNGNGIQGAAGQAAVALRQVGYQVFVQEGMGGNADHQNYANTRVQFKAARDKPLAQEIADRFPGATIERHTGANPTQARILVIVGKAADGMTPHTGETAENNKVPEEKPPNVLTDREYGREAFATLRGETKVPVMYPTVREAGSTYMFPIRAYTIPKGRETYHAYRMVARTAQGDYWGLQATTWPDPPIIADPTREVTRGNRTYMLFFNGTRLHMVAWRQNGAVYWVSNSVLDKLGNETMLAIAEGVRPLPR